MCVFPPLPLNTAVIKITPPLLCPRALFPRPGRAPDARGLSTDADEDEIALRWSQTTSSAQNHTCCCHNARGWHGKRILSLGKKAVFDFFVIYEVYYVCTYNNSLQNALVRGQARGLAPRKAYRQGEGPSEQKTLE